MSKRADAIGFFWQDVAAVKPPAKEKVKIKPPERTWESPDYLPGLYEALAFNVEHFTDGELLRMEGKELIFDIEIYPNYFLAAFRCPETRKYVGFEIGPGLPAPNLFKMKWILEHFLIIGFNSNDFDMPIAALACAGAPVETLKWAANEIIENGAAPHNVLRGCKVKKLDVNHIDLIEVAPLTGSLKKYASRLHINRMQDLPFPPQTVLSSDQIAIVRWYCVNSDIPATIALRQALDEQLALRDALSWEYKLDLRSKSDAQIAEAVIGSELTKLQGRPSVPKVEPGTKFSYKPPHFIRFESELMKWVLNTVCSVVFEVNEFGNANTPDLINDLKIRLAAGVYRFGRGGLHSSEQSVAHIVDQFFRLRDIDAESFYPKTMINQGMYPVHLGPNFLRVYEKIVNRRLHAKAMQKKCKESGDKVGELRWKVEQESLKITINGTFGKLGSMFSILYAPELLMQVTLSGQLALLMLIERMELACISVVSANTDGIVMRMEVGKEKAFADVVAGWERDTGYVTEETEYKMLLSRDVNNYIAIKLKDGTTKTKGAFANPWSIPNNIWRLHKNPVNMICTEAIEDYLTKQIPISKTISECRDITKFCAVRDVKGGGVKIDSEGKTQLYLGKMVRWYWSTEESGMIVYAKSGKKVADSTNSRPAMDLPEVFPSDIDFGRYIMKAEDMLLGMGYK